MSQLNDDCSLQSREAALVRYLEEKGIQFRINSSFYYSDNTRWDPDRIDDVMGSDGIEWDNSTNASEIFCGLIPHDYLEVGLNFAVEHSSPRFH